MEVFPTGGIVWRYRYRLNSKYEKLTLGKYPALTLKNARLKRDETAQQVAMGESPAKKKQQVKVAGAEDATVAEFAERFFKDIQSRDRKDVTAEDVRSVIWRKKEQGFDAAAGQVRGLLKRMFDYALTYGLIQANPVMQTSNIRRQFKIAFQLILMTLVRKSKLMLAQWKDVHLDEGEWHIPVENSKIGKPHIVYLSTQAQSLFKELKPLASSSVWVLPGRGTLAKPFANNALNQALKVSLQGQEIPAFTIHDLRRTASTLLHEQGWSSDVVEKALNHTISGVRGVYNRAEYAEQQREMLQAWSDYIDGLAPSANLVV